MIYGIPYMGSKTKIAPKIIERLPSGKRFVDLFGGGFAMSQVAAISGKFENILYRDIDPLIPPLLHDAIRGGYNYNVFKPRFIEPEEFHIKKHTDGYIKFLWSFGSNGKQYLFGPDNIDVKREAHNFIVFGTPTLHFREIEKLVTSKDIHKRKSQFIMAVNQELKKGGRMQMLERLHRLQNLQTLESLHRKISFETGSYQEYKYEPGDIVYCDPPYEGTAEYSTKFNSKDFYDWVKAQPYPVWFSSYQGVSGFQMVFAKQLRSTYGSGNKSINFECLYTNQ